MIVSWNVKGRGISGVATCVFSGSESASGKQVILENFKPGRMESWALGPDDLMLTNPDLIFTRVSGYGQDGPYATKPGYEAGVAVVACVAKGDFSCSYFHRFASACEAMGGFR